MFRELLFVLAILRFNCDASDSMSNETYSDKYDYIDTGEVLKNDRLREEYFKCFLDRGPCVTAAAKYYHQYILDGFLTECRKCTDKQKSSYRRIIEFYSTQKPEQWKEIQQYLDEHRATVKPKKTT